MTVEMGSLLYFVFMFACLGIIVGLYFLLRNKTEKTITTPKEPKQPKNDIEQEPIDFLDLDEIEINELPEENKNQKTEKKEIPELETDLQKELEAKFDELFGPME